MEGHWQHDIYKLSRNSEKFNEFYVKVEVYFIDGSPMSSTDTRNFTVRNKAKEGNNNGIYMEWGPCLAHHP